MNAIGTILEHKPIISSGHKSITQPKIVDNQARKANRDTFEYDNVKKLNTSTYSPASVSSKTKASSEYSKDYAYNPEKTSSADEAESVQAVASANGTSNYYDVIINRAAMKAGISVSSAGYPQITGNNEARIYGEEITRIRGTFWCQTGGWGFANEGKSSCMRTAAATLVSINSGVTVKPTDVASDVSSIKINGVTHNRNGNKTSYNYSSGADTGLTLYDLNNQTDLINAVNNELKNNRAVMVKTTTSKGYEHWVTITGTKNGKPAASYNDLVGVDPWYNGGNSHNPQPGIEDSSSSNYSGVFTVSDIRSLNMEYKIMTYRD